MKKWKETYYFVGRKLDSKMDYLQIVFDLSLVISKDKLLQGHPRVQHRSER